LAAAITRDDHLAEDAVQQAFLTALARLSTLREDGAFWGWFRKIIRTECVRILRKRREQICADVPETADHAPSPRRRAQSRDLRRVVRAALAALPETSRGAAEMFYLEERRCIDIGESLGVPEGTVKRRLHDARKQLHRLLLGYIPDRTSERSQPQTRLPL
jgi:RNA polymerase sigma factor (sigma-70 family)